MTNEAIILAAGESRRLLSYIDFPKPILQLTKIKLIQFPLLSLYLSGVKRFIVITQEKIKDKIHDALSILDDIKFDIIVNDAVYRENGYSLYLGLKAAKNNIFFVSMADHIYPPDIPRKLVYVMRASNADIIIAADSKPRFVDIEEATKIKVKKDLVVRIGKKLNSFEYIDAGVFFMNKKVLDSATDLIRSKEKVSVSDIVNHAIDRNYVVRIADISSVPWMDVDTPEDVKTLLQGQAKDFLQNLVDKYYNYVQ